MVVLGFITGTLLSARLSSRYGIDRLLFVGALLSALAGTMMAVLSGIGVNHVMAVIGPMVLYMIGVGIVMPQAMAGAIGPFPHMAGVASALFGFVQSTLAALVGVGVGHLHNDTPIPMTLVIALMGVATPLVYWWLVRRSPFPVQQKGLS